MVQKYFKRFEIKYQISAPERERLARYLGGFMQADKHTQNNLHYEVRSLYFDSPQRKAFYDKVNGVKMRKKLRIRYYPQKKTPEMPMVFIEIKRKANENVSKARIQVPAVQVFQILDDDSAVASELYRNSSVLDRKTLEEIWYLKKRFDLKPVCTISYNRQALTGISDKNFRVTFDTDLRASKNNFDLLDFDPKRSKLIFQRDLCVMEVKFNNIIPKWAVNIVQINNCVQEKISKFATGLQKTNLYSIV